MLTDKELLKKELVWATIELETERERYQRCNARIEYLEKYKFNLQLKLKGGK